jgi:transcriptional regulator with XRE-family HTH domain
VKYENPATIVRHVRESAGITQRDLARTAGTAQSVVARIELGQTDPTWGTLSRLADAAGYHLRPLLEKRPQLDESELDDIPRILRLTPEERLLEVANLSQFMMAGRRA